MCKRVIVHHVHDAVSPTLEARRKREREEVVQVGKKRVIIHREGVRDAASRKEMVDALVAKRSIRLHEAYPKDQAEERLGRVRAEYASMDINTIRKDYGKIA